MSAKNVIRLLFLCVFIASNLRLTMVTPSAEIDVNDTLVASLLEAQFPDLAQLSLCFLESGWDNVMYRLGDFYIIRLPRREVAAQLIRNEQAWLPVIGERLPIDIPLPLYIGTPTDDYPWHWSILPWLHGTAVDEASPLHREEAGRMAQFLKALHQTAPDQAPSNTVRGVALHHRQEVIDTYWPHIKECTELLTVELEALWRAGLQAPQYDTKVWLHGDLHARNVLAKNGRITGIIDWGDMTSGDPATDLACAWHLFDEKVVRERFLQLYGADEALIIRAKAWALLVGTVLLGTGLKDHPRHAEMGRMVFRRLSQDI